MFVLNMSACPYVSATLCVRNSTDPIVECLKTLFETKIASII